MNNRMVFEKVRRVRAYTLRADSKEKREKDRSWKNKEKFGKN